MTITDALGDDHWIRNQRVRVRLIRDASILQAIQLDER